MRSKLFIVAVAALVGCVVAACASEPETEHPEGEEVVPAEEITDESSESEDVGTTSSALNTCGPYYYCNSQNRWVTYHRCCQAACKGGCRTCRVRVHGSCNSFR